MKPSATHKWLLASVLAVSWAIIITISWMLLAFLFGRGRGDMRLITMLIIAAVVGAFLCAYAYSEGSKSGPNDDDR